MSRVLRFVLWLMVGGLVVVVGVVATVVIVDGRARDADEVRVVEVPFEDVGGLTVGRIVFVADDRADDADLLAHELVHVCQWEELGIRFLWEYGTEFATNYRELDDSREAYMAISFEEQARVGTSDCDIDRYNVTTVGGG